MAKKKGWIKGAIKHPGAFKAKAKKAGMGTQAYARKERHASGKLGDEARLDLELQAFHRK